MDTIRILQVAINYIEENLTVEISIDEVARKVGFSSYHFSHLFSEIVGISVSAYITKRRVRNATYEISNGGKMIDITLAYGFDTYAGFYKAFKREFGCSPSKFLKLNTAKKPQAVNLSEEAKRMLTNKRVKEYLSNWELDTELKINPTFIGGGIVQTSNVWDINNKYIFKTGKDIVGLRGEITLAKELKKTGLKGKHPIQTKNGEDFIVDGDKFYIVTNKIAGNVTSSEERYGDEGMKIANEYGNAIGRLHKGFLKVEEVLEVDDTDMLKVVVDYAMPKTKNIMEQWGCPLPDEFYKEYIENFSKLHEKLPRQLIHRDVNPSNIIYDEGKVTGFIDFDLSERNIRIFDPCYCATGILSEAGESEDRFEKWPQILEQIIKGYDEVLNLTVEERQAIPYVIYSIQIIFIAWLIDNEKYKDCALQNRKMLVWMWENREKLF